MIALLFIILAACCNVIMDGVEPYHINATWLPRSWAKARIGKILKGTRWKMDAWHIAKSSMICLLIGAIFVYKPIINVGGYYITAAIHFVGYGIVWCIVFGQGYKLINKKR